MQAVNDQLNSNKISPNCVTLEALLDSASLVPSSPLTVPLQEPLSDTNKTVNLHCTSDSNQSVVSDVDKCISSAGIRTLIREMCMELLCVLKDQDVNGYLMFSPAYSQRIKLSGDKLNLSEIEKRVTSQLYTTLSDFQKDIMDSCTGVLIYYQSDPIRYQEIRRLTNIVQEWFSSVPREYLTNPNSNGTVKIEDNEQLDTEELPTNKYIRMETNLNILNPDNKGMLNKTERVRCIGDEAGQLQSGSYLLPNGGYREDRRNKIIPYTYLDYGPFYSFGPTYDSGASHCTPETNELILGTIWLPARTFYSLGDQRSTKPHHALLSEEDWIFSDENISSIASRGDAHLTQALSVAQNEYKATCHLANELDEILPGTAEASDDCVYSICLANLLTREFLKQNKKSDTNEQFVKIFDTGQKRPDLCDVNNNNCDLDSVEHSELQTLNETDSTKPDTRHQLDSELDESAKDLHSLYCAQYLRLGDISQTTNHTSTIQPNSNEFSIARKLAGRLVNMAKRARPRDLVHPYTVRRAMGLEAENFYLPEEVEVNGDAS